jgi:ATPase family associated with various cellular activities (AAA)
VLHFLAGVQHVDARLERLVREHHAADALAPTQQRAADRLAARLLGDRMAGRWPTVVLTGPEHRAKRDVAAAACERAGWALYVVRFEALPEDPAESAALRRLWEREAALTGSALLVDCEDWQLAEPAPRAALASFADGMQAALLVAAPHPPAALESAIRAEVPRPTSRERRALWAETLGPRGGELNGRLDAIVDQFVLEHADVRAATADALASHDAAGPLGDRLWDACRVRSRPRLDDLGQRIEATTTWDDLVLPPVPLGALRQLAAQVRQRSTVYEEWGFARRTRRGLGISALFAGQSGTGKTMAAEAVANELCLDLYRIDLSSVVSKYIGETEKNLRWVFDAADRGGAVLLFDEADALFGKRTEVEDSHDRFANIEVSYLLQRMEAYEGLAILTTNMRAALDEAFLRRLRFVIEFPFPDASQRAEIWRRVFPPEAPTDALDASLLARMDIAGGSIRNIAVGAAFLAADAGSRVGMDHVVSAAVTEYAKLERPLPSLEVSA